MTKLITIVALTALVQSAGYRAQIEQFHTERTARLTAEDGWTALTDLRWLDTNGQFTIGRSASNAIVLHAPSAPARLGVLIVAPSSVTLRVDPGVDARAKNQPVKELALAPDAD